MAGFQFKEFFVHHDRSAMKVGTDGILLGAWPPLDDANCSILDIGTGTGLIALMLAQRSSATSQITALEISPEAAAEATENAAVSPWSDQIRVVTGAVQEFFSQSCFDLIVSNPPFYRPGQTLRSSQRALARHAGSLTQADLLAVTLRLLSPEGKAAFIFPVEEGKCFLASAEDAGLKPERVTHVSPASGRPSHRLLMLLSRQAQKAIHDGLDIHNDAGEYSDEFTALTRTFYLKMW